MESINVTTTNPETGETIEISIPTDSTPTDTTTTENSETTTTITENTPITNEVTTSTVDTTVVVDVPTTTETEYGVSGDVICNDGNRYSIEPGVEIPDNCADEAPVTNNSVFTEVGVPNTLPATGNETTVTGGVGLLALAAGVVLVRLSKKSNPQLK